MKHLRESQLSLELIELLDKMPGLKTLNAQNIGDDIFKFKSPIIEELTIYSSQFNETLLENFPNMHKITVLGADFQFWTKLNSIERQISSLQIGVISYDVPSYLIGSALVNLKSLSMRLNNESYDRVRSLIISHFSTTQQLSHHCVSRLQLRNTIFFK